VDVSVESVAGELMKLQRNRGLQAGDIGSKVGPSLARLTGFSPARGAEGRQSLARQLVRAAHTLPPDQRMIFLRASAVRPTDASTLSERLDSVITTIDRSFRVVRRRLSEANLAVAERLIATAVDDRGWFLAELRATVDFREERPIHRAQRTLVVTAPTLERVTEMISLPGFGDEAPELLVKGAARLEEVNQTGPQTWEFILRLDAPRACGDLVEYETALRLPSRREGDPLSVMAPRRDCWRFETQVHLGGLADRAWVLDGVTAPTALSEEPGGTPIDLAADPSPSVTFRDLTPGLVYGIKWHWADPGFADQGTAPKASGLYSQN